MERRTYGCFPNPLYKAHPGAPYNLLKEGTCLGCFGLGRGAPFLPCLWGATPFMPVLRTSPIPARSLQSVGLLNGVGHG